MTAGAEAVIYCDTSALARAYLVDEVGHDELRERLLAEPGAVVSSALTEVELVAAISAAGRAGRIARPDLALARLATDLHRHRTIVLIALDGAAVPPRARDLCERHRLRALDAIHIAVCLGLAGEASPDVELFFVTRDADQAAAARAEGLRVA